LEILKGGEERKCTKKYRNTAGYKYKRKAAKAGGGWLWRRVNVGGLSRSVNSAKAV
jgi:hypothetical protein